MDIVAIRDGIALQLEAKGATSSKEGTRMWESADAMPSLPEIAEPRLWFARTVSAQQGW